MPIQKHATKNTIDTAPFLKDPLKEKKLKTRIIFKMALPTFTTTPFIIIFANIPWIILGAPMQPVFLINRQN